VGSLQDYTKAIELNPKFADAYYNRGLLRFNNRRDDGAIRDFTKAIELKPRLTPAYSKRALARKNKGDYLGAIADLEQAIQLQPARKKTLESLIREIQTRQGPVPTENSAPPANP
jgi:tetratricopeptide (TPR) repeat protein